MCLDIDAYINLCAGISVCAECGFVHVYMHVYMSICEAFVRIRVHFCTTVHLFGKGGFLYMVLVCVFLCEGAPWCMGVDLPHKTEILDLFLLAQEHGW